MRNQSFIFELADSCDFEGLSLDIDELNRFFNGSHPSILNIATYAQACNSGLVDPYEFIAYQEEPAEKSYYWAYSDFIKHASGDRMVCFSLEPEPADGEHAPVDIAVRDEDVPENCAVFVRREADDSIQVFRITRGLYVKSLEFLKGPRHLRFAIF